MAAETLAQHGIGVVLIDHMRLPGRKFLLAGRGGLNLTHSEAIDKLLRRYANGCSRLEPAIRAFPPAAVRQWCESLGEPTFVGSSGRVFPKSMKASPLLRKWLRRLTELGVQYRASERWTGFSAEPTILALGGASWPELGSDASWTNVFAQAGVQVVPFVGSNARQRISWSPLFSTKHAGTPLKNVVVSHGENKFRGEIIISRDGIEGTPIYALSLSCRENPHEPLIIDLKPDLDDAEAVNRLAKQRKKDSFSSRYRKAFGLTSAAIALIREVGSFDPKRVVLQPSGVIELARAISSAGGVSWDEIDDAFRLKKQPQTMVIGEMIDWDAPTGGYLLQACLSTGKYAAMGYLHRNGFIANPPI